MGPGSIAPSFARAIARAALAAALALTASTAVANGEWDGEWTEAGPVYESAPAQERSETAPSRPARPTYSRPAYTPRPPPSPARPVRITDPKKRTMPPESTMSYAPLSNGLVRWRCERKTDVLQMSSLESDCSFQRHRGASRTRDEFNPAFARHLDKHMFRCIARSAERAGLPRPARAEIGNMSGHRASDHGRHKYHGRARALDVGRIRLLDANGNPIPLGIRSLRYRRDLRVGTGEILLHREYYKTDRTTRKFYDALRRCWGESLRPGCDRSGGFGTIGCEGSGGYDNAAHNDHIHFQFPESCGY